jgi:uncharacterized membrane protein YfcA
VNLPLEVYIIAPAIVLLAYTVFATSGFGSTLIAVPLLAHLLPIKFVVPLVVLLDFAGAMSLGLRFRQGIDTGELRWMMPPLIVGIAVGTLLLLNASPQALVAVLGVLVAAYGAYSVFAKPPVRSAPRWTGLAAAFCGGTIASSIGAGGPLFMMYLSRRIADNTRLRSTISALFATTTSARIAIFVFAGLFLQDDLLVLAVLLLPFIFLGLYIGHRLHLKLSRDTMFRFIGVLLGLAGLSLIRRAVIA